MRLYVMVLLGALVGIVVSVLVILRSLLPGGVILVPPVLASEPLRGNRPMVILNLHPCVALNTIYGAMNFHGPWLGAGLYMDPMFPSVLINVIRNQECPSTLDKFRWGSLKRIAALGGMAPSSFTLSRLMKLYGFLTRLSALSRATGAPLLAFLVANIVRALASVRSGRVAFSVPSIRRGVDAVGVLIPIDIPPISYLRLSGGRARRHMGRVALTSLPLLGLSGMSLKTGVAVGFMLWTTLSTMILTARTLGMAVPLLFLFLPHVSVG